MIEYTDEEKFEWMQERLAISYFDGRLNPNIPLERKKAERQAIEDWYAWRESLLVTKLDINIEEEDAAK